MNDDKESQGLPVVFKFLLVLSAIIAGVSLYIMLSSPPVTKPLAGTGNMIKDEASIGGDFELVDQDGNLFNSDKLKGKISLIYFGFTYCPDICPTSLQKLTEVLQVLDKYHIDVNPVFITIDSERDNSKLLKEYLGHFHPKFIGLTGTSEQIRDVASKFKVYYARSEESSGSSDYMLDHSSFTYVMDKDMQYMKHFYLTSSPEEIVEYCRINK